MVDWLFILEYLKVLLSGPTVSLAIALLFIFLFKSHIGNFIDRLSEATVLGTTVKAAPAQQQEETNKVSTDPLTTAAEAATPAGVAINPPEHEAELPPSLVNDQVAQQQLAYVKQNPVQVLLEYRQLFTRFKSERLFNLVYGSQILLLTTLEDEPSPVTPNTVWVFYDMYKQRGGSVEYKLQAYLDWMIGWGLIVATGSLLDPKYSIAEYGREFLQYIRENYPESWIMRTL